MEDPFPTRMSITLGAGDGHQTVIYEKVTWNVGGKVLGLRYGDNPGQAAALWRPINGNFVIGGCETIQSGKWLAGDMELLQSGKHPGKTNITDTDNGLNILRWLMCFSEDPTAVILKHNNPSGVAIAQTLAEAYVRADQADRVAAFGGAVCFNRPVDKATAEEAAKRYVEVVAAPDFEEGVFEILSARKNLRIIRISRMDQLRDYVGVPVVNFKSLMDGCIVTETSFDPRVRSADDLKLAECEFEGKTYKIALAPTDAQLKDMLFGWYVEAGITSNSVIFVKDLCTVGIGTGEQDRLGVAQIARDKAFRKLTDWLCFQDSGMSFEEMMRDHPSKARRFAQQAIKAKGNLPDSVMVSDAFFPFRDGVDVGLREGVKAVVQPGGSMHDWQAIEACNEHSATMCITGQRSFKH